VAEGLAVHDAVEETNAAEGHRLHVVATPIEERTDEPPPLQPVRLWKGVPPLRVVLIRSGRHKYSEVRGDPC
jgi:hypothetical protein